MKQNDAILDYIQRNGSITALQAVRDLGIMRLASRVKELRDLGHPINGVMRYAVNKDGVNKKWKEYYLA